MKLISFIHDGLPGVGVLTDAETVVDLLTASHDDNEPWPMQFIDMIALLDDGAEGMIYAHKTVATALRTGVGVLPLAEVTLQAPVPCPGKLFALAGNYADHILEGGHQFTEQDKQTPRVFMKPPTNTVVGPGAEILIPEIAQGIDWEGELAVVIGRHARNVKRADALDYVAGYTIMNDVSERKLKIWDRSESRPRDEWFDWLNGKWYDTFAPMGPCLVTRDEIPDPQNLQISTYVNGERKQHCSTAQMIFPVAAVIEYISAMVTLSPGDVISTGTVAGVGNTTGTYLQPGDVVKVAIGGIGELENPVAKERGPEDL